MLALPNYIENINFFFFLSCLHKLECESVRKHLHYRQNYERCPIFF